METTAARTSGMSAIGETDFVYEAIKGAGMVGGYIQNILADTIYFAGRYIAYVRDMCSGYQGSLFPDRLDESKISMVRMVRSDAVIDDADKHEFYLRLGRDLVAATKAGLESENLTMIDLSRYEL